MATAAHPVHVEKQPVATPKEQALCDMFDVVEDALENLTPEQRKAWLNGLSDSAGKPEKRS